MQRTASQRKAKKVGIPSIPNLLEDNLKSNSASGANDSVFTSAAAATARTFDNNKRITTTSNNDGANHIVAAMDNNSSSGFTLGSQYRTSNEKDNNLAARNHAAYPNAVVSQQHAPSSFATTNIQQLQQTRHHVVGNNVFVGNACPTGLTNGSPMKHRNSTGSTSSHSSSGFESMRSGSQHHCPNVVLASLRGESPPSRNSVHSSGSSSLGSLEKLDESGSSSSAATNLPEMVLNGIPDNEIISAWLHNLHYEDYLPLFLNAGYDLATVARMTPEDLTAIGITKPGHRKRLTTEIHKMNVVDKWPDRKPADVSAWLAALNLSEYACLFASQGYDKMDKVLQMIWEDFEDIGVKKLGHLKKLVCAVKKLKDGRSQAPNGQRKSNASSLDSVSLPCASAAFKDSTEILVINHQSANGQKSQSPYAMVTFQQSPKCLNQSQEFQCRQNFSPSPAHSSLVHTGGKNHSFSNGSELMSNNSYARNYSNLTINHSFKSESATPCGGVGPSSSPWRRESLVNHYQTSTRSLAGTLHRTPSIDESARHASPSHIGDFLDHSPCSVASTAIAGSSESVVQIRPVAKIATKTRRGSRGELQPPRSTKMMMTYTNGNNNSSVVNRSFSSSSCENLMHRSLTNCHSTYYDNGVTTANCTTSRVDNGELDVGGTSQRRQSYQQIFHEGGCSTNYSHFNLTQQHSDSLIVWNSNNNGGGSTNRNYDRRGSQDQGHGRRSAADNDSSTRVPRDQDNGFALTQKISLPTTNLPPQCSSYKSCHVFQLSSHTQPSEELGAELSPAQSIEDFPPPPDPIMCEEHIKHLRTIQGNGSGHGGSHLYGGLKQSKIPDAKQKPLNLQPQAFGEGPQTTLTEQHRTKLCSISPLQQNFTRDISNGSVDSNSSTETLPFANENIGTIRQKSGSVGPSFCDDDDDDDANNSVAYCLGDAKYLRQQYNLLQQHKSPCRPPIGEIFSPTSSAASGSLSQKRNATSTPVKKSTAVSDQKSSGAPGNVLSDIGNMLQDLTDELDALLYDPINNNCSSATCSKSQAVI